MVWDQDSLNVCVFNTSPGSVRVVRAEGMPQYRNPFEKGDLFVKFEVQFPQNNWISPEKLTVRALVCVVALVLSCCQACYRVRSFAQALIWLSWR